MNGSNFAPKLLAKQAGFAGRSEGADQKQQFAKSKSTFVDQTSFSMALRAKQNLKLGYGELKEKQFFHIYQKALKYKGELVDNLVALLERRLDTVVLRMNFCPGGTWFSARQFINHGHIWVQKTPTGAPKVFPSGTLLKDGSIIEVARSSLGGHLPAAGNQAVRKAHSSRWLEINHKILSGIFLWAPGVDEIGLQSEHPTAKAPRKGASAKPIPPLEKVVRKFYWL